MGISIGIAVVDGVFRGVTEGTQAVSGLLMISGIRARVNTQCHTRGLAMI